MPIDEIIWCRSITTCDAAAGHRIMGYATANHQAVQPI